MDYSLLHLLSRVKEMNDQTRVDECACVKHLPVTFIIVKENGEEIGVCAECMMWWKALDPSITIWTV